MKADVTIKTDKELFKRADELLINVPNINILHLTPPQLHRHLDTNVYLRSSMFILVLSGTSDIEINFRKYKISQGEIILLSFGHFFKIKQFSSDFRCVVLYVSKDYIDEMFSTEMIYKRVKYGVKMHKTPLLKLSDEESTLLY
jgi:AraC family transcriptional activator of pobA